MGSMSTLKPVGVFWDIENCCVPKGKSALKIIERIRERFFRDYREAEFICVCDINKESEATIKDLNDGQINVVHINAVAKNAADDKIRQSLRRFSDSHPPGTRVILISSDVNFASDLSDLRHRKKFDVVLIHKAQVNEALLSCAAEHFFYEDLIRDLPDRPGFIKEAKDNVLVIHGYCKEGPLEKIRHALKMLSNNCGGKVLSIGPLFAILKFDTPELLERARKRMNGEDVYGRKITVCLPEETTFYNTIKKLTVANLSKRQESPSPQRRPGRERTSSRGFTPDPYDTVAGGNPLSHQYPFFYDTLLGQEMNKGNVSGNQFTPSTVVNDIRAYKAPGGPVRNQSGHVNSPSIDGQGNSPSHTHTLPNSNSEKYYSTKSGPSSLENSPSLLGGGGRSSLGTGNAYGSSNIEPTIGSMAYVLGDLSNAASSGGEPITVFKPANKQRLADIPIPSFGFRDIPPPSMSSAIADSSNVVTKSSAFDPIKLIETASMDSRAYMTSRSSLLGPDLVLEHPDSQPPSYLIKQQVSHGGIFSNLSGLNSSSKIIDNSSFISPQASAFTRHHSTSSEHQTQHQSRSLSVPVHNPSASVTKKVEKKSSIMHTYSPTEDSRSKSQNSSVFKEPIPYQNPYKNVHNPGGYKRHQSLGRGSSSRSSSREVCKNVSSDEDRPFSPVSNPSTGRLDFRPRLASAPSSGVASGHNTGRIPSPLTGPSMMPARMKQHGCNLYRVPTPAEIGDPSTDYLHPEFHSWNGPYVELVVSNLDYNILPREWRKIIYATFHPHVKILRIQVRLQADQTSVATVRLPSEQDARFAIAQFHRRKIGYKRINVQFKSDCSQSPADSLRADTVALLMEAKDNKMPLSRLIDLFDKRFHKTVSVSDIYKMRDVVQIMEIGGAGRWVKLQSGIRRSPTPIQNLEEAADAPDEPVCKIHCQEGSVSYTEALNTCMLPNVLILRKHFSPQLHSLLLSHNGSIPLMSFPICFAAEFHPIEFVNDGGIPLEHVISCVPGVEIILSPIGVKKIQFQENRDQFYDMMKGNSWQELGKISREVMELLRQQPTCTMPVSKFIPSYHHYFGRQCRVADYGYTKLQELFEAIPHAIEILGAGDRKAITLSPRAQLKRFTTDILKVVKMQPAKQILLSDFAKAYEKVMGKPLYLPHYGICFMEDVLLDISTTVLIVIEEDKQTLLALPRRDQTPEEVERTKQFTLEVVDLLKQYPQCSMAFNKFIPAYHHHFGRQCRVADFGFSKLTDLFEAIAHVIEIEEDGEERMIRLAPAELRKVLCEQLTSLIRPVGAILVSKILVEYARHFGFNLKPDDFGAGSTMALLLKLKNHIKIEVRDGQEYATLVKEFRIPQVGLQVMQLLMDESGGSLPVMELCMRYESKFGLKCDISQIRDELSDYVQIDESEFDTGGIIRLTSQQMLGRNLRLLLLHHGCISLNDLNVIYREQYGVELSPALYGFTNLCHLLQSFPHILELKGKSLQKYIQSAGMLAIPDTLPPSRVDVTSPVQNLSSVPANMNMSVSDLLRHASQLWDHSMVLQSGADAQESSGLPADPRTSSSCIMDLLSGKLSTVALNGDGMSTPEPRPTSSTSATNHSSKSVTALSQNGVPIAWQMKAGVVKTGSDSLAASGSQPSPRKSTLSPASKSKKKSPKSGKFSQIRILSRNPVEHHCADGQLTSTLKQVSADMNEMGDRNAGCDNPELPAVDNIRKTPEDIFSPLDTSSTNSQHSSSSESSVTSPIKRKTRIAANFKVSQ